MYHLLLIIVENDGQIVISVKGRRNVLYMHRFSTATNYIKLHYLKTVGTTSNWTVDGTYRTL